MSFCIDKMPEKYKQLGRIEFVAKGSMGTVYKIIGAKENYALKVVICGKSNSKYRTIMHEVSIMQELSGCDNIVKLVDVSERCENENRIVFLLEEYVIPLARYASSGRNLLSASGAVKIACDVVAAMLKCEEMGIAHLDIQPNNIFITKKGKVVLGDFSSSLTLSELSTNKKMRGTLAYMAPEVYRSKRCSIKSEIYSLGVVLYALFNNMKVPFLLENERNDEIVIYKRLAGAKFPDVNTVTSEVWSELEPIISKACAFDVENRYACIEDLSADLNSLWIKLQQNIIGDCIIETKVVDNLDSSDESDTLDGKKGSTIPPHHMQDTSQSTSIEHLHTYDPDPFATTVADYWMEAGGDDNVDADVQNEHKWYDTRLVCSSCGCIITFEKFCPNCGMRIERVRPGVRIDRVDFYVTAPNTAKPGEYYVIDVLMFEEKFRRVVEDMIVGKGSHMKETSSGIVRVTENARIKMVISSPDFIIDKDTEEREWVGNYLNVSFSVLIPEKLASAGLNFIVTVFVNDIMSTRLSFVSVVSERPGRNTMDIQREDVRSVFVSYAKEDKNRALRVLQGVRMLRPDMDILLNIPELRDKKCYEDVVKREIDNRDVFYLCWSGFAKRDANVNSEWRYALEKKGLDGIEIVPLELIENCPPPNELDGKCFYDQTFRFMDTEEVNNSKVLVQITDDVWFDQDTESVKRNGKDVKLRPQERKLLKSLVDNRGRTVTYGTLIRAVYDDYDDDLRRNGIAKIVTGLREKLGETSIDTKHGEGYKINKI